jgi:U3 small nucleolar RNA-associated protein 20
VENSVKQSTEGKEICLKLEDISALIMHDSFPKDLLGLIPNFLFGTFCIKFSMLWPYSIRVFSALSIRFPQLFWETFYDKFSSTTEILKNGEPPFEPPFFPEDILDIPIEEEFRWEDDNSKALISPQFERLDFEPSDITNSTSLGIFYEQLLQTMAFIPESMEKHSREIVPRFFEFCDEFFKKEDSEEKHTSSLKSKKRLLIWLDLFSKFTSPRKLHKSEEVRSLEMKYSFLI